MDLRTLHHFFLRSQQSKFDNIRQWVLKEKINIRIIVTKMIFDMRSLKGLYHRRLFAVWNCLKGDPVSYEWGLSMRSVDLIMKSIARNVNRRVEQTMIYFKPVNPNRSICDALCILLFKYHNFLKTIYFLLKWLYGCNFIQVRVLKNYWLLKFHKTNFCILFCDNLLSLVGCV